MSFASKLTKIVVSSGLIFSTPTFIRVNSTCVPDSVSRVPASLLSDTANSCTSVFTKQKKFDAEAFYKHLDQFSKGLLLNKVVLSSQLDSYSKSPEKLLALIEVLSATGDHEGLGLSKQLEELSEKERTKIINLAIKITAKGKISDFSLRKFLAKIYRIVHQPRGYLKTIWQQRGFSKAFEQISDEKIIERIQLSIIHDDIEASFVLVTKDPSLAVQSIEFLKSHKVWMDLSLASLFWASSAFYAPELNYDGTALSLLPLAMYLPPFIPSFRYFLTKHWNPKIQKLFQENRFEEAMKQSVEHLKANGVIIRRLNFIRNGYLTMMAITLAANIAITIIPEAQRAKAEHYLIQQQEELLRLSDRAQSTPEVIGRRNFELLVKILEEDGPIDRSSPQMKALLAHYIEAATLVPAKKKPQSDEAD